MTKKAFILIIILAAAIVLGALYIKRLETPRSLNSVLVNKASDEIPKFICRKV